MKRKCAPLPEWLEVVLVAPLLPVLALVRLGALLGKLCQRAEAWQPWRDDR